MLISNAMQPKQVTPPSSFTKKPLTPPSSGRKPSAQAQQVIALFRDKSAGRYTDQESWIEFQLAPGDYDDIKRLLSHDEDLSGYVDDKIRYDHDPISRQLVVRMPTSVHELLLDAVEDRIRDQLKAIRGNSDSAARFAQKVLPGRSTTIHFPVETGLSNAKSRNDPDASFWHDDALYPGVIIEAAYSQKQKRLARLAEKYLLDSDASVRVVVGLKIGYGKKEACKSTLSVWRTQIFNTAEGDELRVVKVVADEPFRTETGESTNHEGLRLHLSDFACVELTKDIIDDERHDILVSTQELCRYLEAAERKMELLHTRIKSTIAPTIRKRKRFATPPEEITSSDEAIFAEQEARAARRADCDASDYEDK